MKIFHPAMVGVAAIFVAAFGISQCTEARAQEVEFRTSGAIDGDTIIIDEPCSRFQPLKQMRVRIYGIDTPESRMPPAKCEAEVKKGLDAKHYAQSIIKRGDLVKVRFVTQDKYACRIVGLVTLPDGRDFTETMIKEGYARPYGQDGNLTKSDWCN